MLSTHDLIRGPATAWLKVSSLQAVLLYDQKPWRWHSETQGSVASPGLEDIHGPQILGLGT